MFHLNDNNKLYSILYNSYENIHKGMKFVIQAEYIPQYSKKEVNFKHFKEYKVVSFIKLPILWWPNITQLKVITVLFTLLHTK
jgi:hypothetical protein